MRERAEASESVLALIPDFTQREAVQKFTVLWHLSPWWPRSPFGRDYVKMIQHAKRFGRVEMNREVALKMVLALVGLLFLALAYPLIIFVRQDPSLSMMFSLYVTLGFFLLIAIRDPYASRSVIAFTAWSSLAHAAVMGTQALRNIVPHEELIGVVALVVIGVALITLAPARPRAIAALG